MESLNRIAGGRRRLLRLRNWIAYGSAIVCCLLIVFLSTFNLPEAPPTSSFRGFPRATTKLGKLGEAMVDMLPDDLAFTVFVPSERSFELDLGLRANESFAPAKWNDTYAVVSRVLGFSAVPRRILSRSVPPEEESRFDSISGFAVHVSRDGGGGGCLTVNGVRSERVDLRKKEIVVHLMDGAIMDAEFAQSVRPDQDDEG